MAKETTIGEAIELKDAIEAMPKRNEKLAAIGEASARMLQAQIQEMDSEIMAAWAAANAQSLDDDSKPKLKIGFSITLDLDADSLSCVTSVAVRHKIETVETIPDPNQMELIK